MLNFFRKKKNTYEEFIGDFQKEFSRDQKAAIIGSLLLIAYCDGNVNDVELNYLEHVSKIINIDLDDPNSTKLNPGGHKHILRILDTLSEKQKKWYVFTIHSMAIVDGKLNDKEDGYTKGFAQDIGISEEQYILIISKITNIAKNIKF